MKHILKCKSCGNYTLEEKCQCGGECITPKPMKYSPDEKYAEYRRKVKETERKEAGLI